jgi:hypothetical protein
MAVGTSSEWPTRIDSKRLPRAEDTTAFDLGARDPRTEVPPSPSYARNSVFNKGVHEGWSGAVQSHWNEVADGYTIAFATGTGTSRPKQRQFTQVP